MLFFVLLCTFLIKKQNWKVENTGKPTSMKMTVSFSGKESQANGDELQEISSEQTVKWSIRLKVGGNQEIMANDSNSL